MYEPHQPQQNHLLAALSAEVRQRRSLGRRITLLMLLPSTLWFLLLLLMLGASALGWWFVHHLPWVAGQHPFVRLLLLGLVVSWLGLAFEAVSAFGTVGLADKGRDLPDIQQHLLVRVVMLHLDQGTRGAHHDPQLFVQFAGKRGRHRLALFDLASGKFPQTALVLGIGATRNQDLAAGITDDCCRYMDSFHRTTSSKPAFCQAWKAGH